MRLTILAIIAGFWVCACTHAQTNPHEASTEAPKLANAWWQWAFSASNDESPVVDRTGANCAFGQTGQLWFLAGGYGSSHIRRECHIPHGKTLFFPLVNAVYYPRYQNSGYSCSEAVSDAALHADSAYELFAELDGTSIPQAQIVRAQSDQCFDIYALFPETAKPYTAYPSATDGYWVTLEPLLPGRHVLKFGGRYASSGATNGRMVQDIEYVLYVGDPGAR